MRIFVLCVVIAFVAPSYGLSFISRNLDLKSIMYAAGGSVQCDVCEMVVTDVQALLKGREGEIENLLDSLCGDLPKEYQGNCTSIIDAYLPMLFALIDDMTPAEVCELLSICTTSDTELPDFSNKRQSAISIVNFLVRSASRIRSLKERRINYIRGLAGEDYLCEACEDSIAMIHEAVACNYTWGMVSNFLSPLCEICPLRDSCYRFFEELPGDVNDFANKYLDPIQDCEIFGFCPEEVEIIIEYEDDEVEVQEIEEEEEAAEEDETMDLIPIQPRIAGMNIKKKAYDISRAKKLKKMGGKKAKNMMRMGQRGMDNFRRRMRRAIRTVIGGQEDVNEIPYDITHEFSTYEEVPTQAKCEVCRYFSSAAEGVLQYNEEDITDGLSIIFEDICNILPDELKTDCTTEIKDVLPDVIYQAALKLMDPDYLCTDMIGICQ